MKPERMERRTAAATIERVEGRTLYGVAIRYNTDSKPIQMGGGRSFVEQIAPGAFRDSITANEVELHWMHGGTADVVASQASGTLVLRDTPEALYFEATVGGTAQDDLYLDRVKRGLVPDMSFGFTVPQDGDQWTNGNTRRRVLRGRLYELSPVPEGAYSETMVNTRARKDEPKMKNAAWAALVAGISALTVREALARAGEIRTAIATEGIDPEDQAELAVALEETRARMAEVSRVERPAPAAPPATRQQQREELPALRWLRQTRSGNAGEHEFSLPRPAEVRATMGVSISGGTMNFGTAAVQPTLEADFIKSLLGPTAIMRLARITPCSGPYNKPKQTSRADYTTGNAKLEGGAGTSRDFKATTVSFQPFAHQEQYETSVELLEDPNYDVLAEILDEIALGQGQWWENQFVNGDGTAGQQAQGIVGVSWTGSTKTSATAATVKFDDCLDLKYGLNSGLHGESVFLMHPTTWGALRKEKTTGGAYVVDGQRDNTIIDGVQRPTIDGSPVFVSSAVPVVAASSKSVFFGSFKRAYEIAMRQKLAVKRAAEDKDAITNGLAFFAGTLRMDGRARDLAAMGVLTTHA